MKPLIMSITIVMLVVTTILSAQQNVAKENGAEIRLEKRPEKFLQSNKVTLLENTILPSTSRAFVLSEALKNISGVQLPADMDILVDRDVQPVGFAFSFDHRKDALGGILLFFESSPRIAQIKIVEEVVANSLPIELATQGYTKGNIGDFCLIKAGKAKDRTSKTTILFVRESVGAVLRFRNCDGSIDPLEIAKSFDKAIQEAHKFALSGKRINLNMRICQEVPKNKPFSLEQTNIQEQKSYILTLLDGKAIPVVKQVAGEKNTKAVSESVKKTEGSPTTAPVSPTEVQIRATYADISLGKDGKHRIKFLKPGKQTVKVFYLDKTGKVYAAGELKVTVQPDPNAPRRGVRKPTRRPADSGNKHPSEEPKSPAQPKVSK